MKVIYSKKQIQKAAKFIWKKNKSVNIWPSKPQSWNDVADEIEQKMWAYIKEVKNKIKKNIKDGKQEIENNIEKMELIQDREEENDDLNNNNEEPNVRPSSPIGGATKTSSTQSNSFINIFVLTLEKQPPAKHTFLISGYFSCKSLRRLNINSSVYCSRVNAKSALNSLFSKFL